ncbi:hypothetical protein BH23CHL8_BH23CHL8_29200 [soil metagenome]
MHADDDHDREETVLASLGLERPSLAGRYFRLPLATAAGGRPVLTVPEWRSAITDWLRYRRAILLVIDTATGATRRDPWGEAMQEVFHDLRRMLDAYPALAIVLAVHVRKPAGKGERRISDVLGEWGRWCDVVVLQENDGADLDRTKISVRKRVRRQRRIVATKKDGLLVDATEAESKGSRVPEERVLAAIRANEGLLYADLAKVLGVSKDTATRAALSWTPVLQRSELSTVFGLLASGAIRADEAATVVAETIRAASIAPLHVALPEVVTQLALDAMTSRWPATLSATLVVRAANTALIVLPQAMDAVRNTCADYVVRKVSQQP